MAIRERVSGEEYHTGLRRSNSSGNYTAVNMLTSRSYCKDWVGFDDNQVFNVSKFSGGGGLINGREKSNITGVEFFDYPAYYFLVGDKYVRSHVPTSSPTDGAAATEALNRTNPSRASVDALVSGLELREIPALVRDAGNTAIGRMFRDVSHKAWRTMKIGSKLNLMYQFGIVPLLSDYHKLRKFERLVDQRFNELQRMRTRGLRRTVEIGQYSGTKVLLHNTVQSQWVLMHCDIKAVTQETVRAHTRWHFQPGETPESDSAMRKLASRAVVSFNADPKAAWDLVPWSWFVDYFTNVGTYLGAKRNTVHAVHDVTSVMRHRITNTKTSNGTNMAGAGGTRITLSPFQSRFETKSRALAPATLNAQQPILSNGQLSILGSLSVLKL